MDLTKISTEMLVKELEKREGVKKETAEPHQNLKIEICGPAVILMVTD